MITNKSLFIVAVNKVQYKVNNYLDQLSIKLSKDESDIVVTLLIKDLMSLSTVFKLNKDNEFEKLMLLTLFSNFQKFLGNDIGVNPLTLVSRWSQLDSKTKEDIFISIEKLSDNLYLFKSLLFLQNKNDKELFELTKDFILLSSHLIVNSDNVITEEERNQLELVNQIIENSNSIINLKLDEKIESLFSENKVEVINKKVSLPVIDDFRNIISKNQHELNQLESNSVRSFVKILTYLNKNEDEIHKMVKTLYESDNPDIVEFWFEGVYSIIRSQNLLYLNSLNMFSSLKKNNLMEYHEYYDFFDKLGVFMTGSETNFKNTLDSINENIQGMKISIIEKLDLISYQLNNIDGKLTKINDNIISVVKSVSSLESSINKGNKMLNDSISNLQNTIQINSEIISGQLKGLQSSMNYNNLVSTVNAYQNYRINSKISKLLTS